ncbi:DNA/RNA non-specific endonuclease [Hymenobacter gummosus]|uniref:DNA/RNA non-specific endonuclease n=2 Tax=Hymenobacter gummosus TaxID=1776032 RepID=A0A3S0JJZ8_9BACT|nr:DNA/RNA non-specific endonuclease [Hymenobacter gummosus]
MATNELTIAVTVRLGDNQLTAELAPQTGVLPQPAAAVAALEAARPLGYYIGYEGYDVNFLGQPVPLPVLTDEQRRNAAKNSSATAGQDPTVLPYTHFSIVMNRRRQLAYYTAVNIDGALIPPAEDTTRGKDKWFYDSRIAESEQIGETLYARNALDRGHLVRRLDPVWGPYWQRANDDTFHFTNCSPQHEKFNQGKDLWQGLENYLLDAADIRDKKMTVFTGPVMDEDDPLYKGVRLPLAFWKILLYQRNNQLVVAAYVLEQGKLIADMLSAAAREAAFEPGAFRVPLQHLIERTGLQFAFPEAQELDLKDGGLNEFEAAHERVALRFGYRDLSM